MAERRPRTRFDRYPMFWLAAAFAAGIVGAKYLPFDLWVTAASSLVLATASALFRARNWAGFLMLAAFVSAGALSAVVERTSISPDRVRVLYDSGAIPSGDPVEVEGVLIGRPEPTDGGSFLTLRVESIRWRGVDRRSTGNVRVFLQQTAGTSPQSYEAPPSIADSSLLTDGSRIRVECRLEREDEYLNPGVIPKREILDRLGVDATGAVKSSLMIERVADEPVFLPLSWVYGQRAVLIDDFRRGMSPQAAGVMIASLLGNKFFLDKNTADLFREGGTFHILVISGLHVTFIGGLLLLLFRQLTRNRKRQFVIVTGALWAYTLAVGADVPVVRASTMFTIVLFGYAVYLRGTLLNSLGICGLVLLVYRPSSLFDPSFQLTFVSVGAIVALAYPLLDTLKRIGSWTPTNVEPFLPRVPEWLTRISETLYWDEAAWAVRSKRVVWSARILKSPYFTERFRSATQKIVRFIFEAVAVSLIVQIAMLPLSVVYFHRVSMASVLLNIWVSFIIAIESFAAVAGAALSHMSAVMALPFFGIADLANTVMLSLPRLLSGLNWASFRLPAYTGAASSVYLLYFLPLIILAFALNLWRPFELRTRRPILNRPIQLGAGSVLIVLLAIIVFHPYSAPRADGRLHIDFLDVGQGDSALITFPNGQTMLVDGGGKPKYRDAQTASDEGNEPFEPDTRGIGEAVVSEVLWYKGYSRIDFLVATHADADHIQGLSDVARNFSVGSAFVARTPAGSSEFIAFAATLTRRSIPATIVGEGDLINVGGASVEVLYPEPLDDPNAASDNDHSIVLRIKYGTRTFLLTGDVERRAESAILNENAILNADIVKVPHHGSRTSSTAAFVDAVSPRYAVISVGRHSPFGHPNEDVVDRWLAAGAEVMTTGERGMISVSTDGADLVVSRWLE